MAKRPNNLESGSFTVKGLEEYYDKIQKAGKNIVGAAAKAIEESIEPIHDDIYAWAEKHELTGETLEGVAKTGAQVEGNLIFAEVGIDTTEAENAWHAVFVEYGTPTQAADPGIRDSFVNNKSEVKKIQRKVLKKEGTPID